MHNSLKGQLLTEVDPFLRKRKLLKLYDYGKVKVES